MTQEITKVLLMDIIHMDILQYPEHGFGCNQLLRAFILYKNIYLNKDEDIAFTTKNFSNITTKILNMPQVMHQCLPHAMNLSAGK